MKLRKILITLTLLAFLSTCAGAFLYYSSLKESALKESYDQTLSSIEVVKNRVSSALSEKLKSVRALSQLREVKRILLKTDEVGLADANRILDFFQDALSVDVCYLLNRDGDAVASSNRGTPESYWGDNFKEHPYFRQALEGTPAIYMALNVATRKRDIYFSHPVHGASEDDHIGVVVTKTSVEPLEKEFGMNFGGIVLLTDPSGIIVVSSRDDWLYRLLWKTSSAETSIDSKSQSASKMPLKWTGLKRKGDHLARDESGSEYLFHQGEVAGYPGWHVVSLTNLDMLSRKFTVPITKAAGYVILTLYFLVGVAVLFLYKEASKDIADRRRAEEALRESERQLRFLSSQLIRTQEEERMRVAKQLKDSIGLSLDAIKYSLENTLRNMEQGLPTKDSLNAVINMTEKPLEESRRIMADLRPSMLDDLGIVVTIGWLCKRFQEAHPEIRIARHVEVEEDAISDHLKLVVFRVLEEAFHNIAKHSNAGNVSLSLIRVEKGVELTVKDDGIGFDLKSALSGEENRRGLGLASMKERVMLSGGAFTLESTKGMGTRIHASWPLRDLERASPH